MALLAGTLECVFVLSMVREVTWGGPWMKTLRLLVPSFSVYRRKQPVCQTCDFMGSAAQDDIRTDVIFFKL